MMYIYNINLKTKYKMREYKISGGEPIITPNSQQKKDATESFKCYYDKNKASFKIAAWTVYAYGTSHDGILLWNENSSAIGFDEIDLINTFCIDMGYTFSCIQRKQNDRGYGGVMIEINLCN